MRKLYLLIFIAICITYYSNGQQPENAGFELWEDAGTVIDEPADWSSIKTSDNDQLNNAAPQVWEQSTEAHTGNFSVRLENKSTFGIVATGTLTNGRVHTFPIADSGYVYTISDDPRWCTPFTGRPDSIAGWFRFYPVNNDMGKLTAILHINSGALPEHGTQDNWVAHAEYIFPPDTIDTWTRFSVPFEYFKPDTPQYILMVLNSGYRTLAVDGSVAYFDDIELIYNPGGIHESKLNPPGYYYYNGYIHFKDFLIYKNKGATLYLMDLNGRVIFSDKIISDAIYLDAQISEGIYLVKVVMTNESYSGKIVIN
jgi:hypothetical protein